MNSFMIWNSNKRYSRMRSPLREDPFQTACLLKTSFSKAGGMIVVFVRQSNKVPSERTRIMSKHSRGYRLGI